MVWVVNTNENCTVTPLEEHRVKYPMGVLEFSKVVDSDIYMCTGISAAAVKNIVHVVVPFGVVSCDTPDMRAFVEAMLVAERPKIFAGHISVLSVGKLFPYSIKSRKFVTTQEFMDSLYDDNYPIKEIIDYMYRMSSVLPGFTYE